MFYFNDSTLEAISVGVGLLSLLGLIGAVRNKATRWPLWGSLLKLGIYSLLVVFNLGAGYYYATVINSLALFLWCFMALRRSIGVKDKYSSIDAWASMDLDCEPGTIRITVSINGCEWFADPVVIDVE